MTTFPTLETAQLCLRPLQPADAAVLHRIYQHDGVLRYFPNPVPPALEKVERFVQSQQEHWVRHGYGNWAIVPHGAADLCGWGGLQFLPELEETEVGFLLDRPVWGRGYASEVGAASLAFGFERCGLDRIVALVHPDNGASRRVLEKCGLVYQETIQLWGMALRRYLAVRPGRDPA